MPIVNDELVTAADLITYDCPKCGRQFRDFTRYQCEECETKFWNEITLNKDWFPKNLEDGTPDWNSVKKDKPQFTTDWSYGRLNIETMQMERVPIDMKGEEWSYLNFKLNGNSIEEEAINSIRAGKLKLTPKKVQVQEQKEQEKEDKKEQKEVMKLINKK